MRVRGMIRGLAAVAAMSAAAVGAHAKNKKDAPLPQLICQGRYVYVQTANGDLLRPDVAPEDRAAANALIAQLQGWKRYALVTEPQQADLIWVVRAGRAVSGAAGPSGSGVNRGTAGQDPTGMGANPNANAGADAGGPGAGRGGQPGGPEVGQSGGMSGPGGMTSGPEASAGMNGDRGAANGTLGAPDDILAVFQRPEGSGPLHSPLWQRAQHEGLEGAMPLFAQIRRAVETSCGSQPAGGQ